MKNIVNYNLKAYNFLLEKACSGESIKGYLMGGVFNGVYLEAGF